MFSRVNNHNLKMNFLTKDNRLNSAQFYFGSGFI